MTLSVLYIHHSGKFGGASRSLLEMIEAFPHGSVTPHLVTQRGNVVGIFGNKGIPVVACIGLAQFDNTRYGYYRRTRWMLLLREILFSFFTILSLLEAKKKWSNIDIVHINEITNLPSVLAAYAIFRKPIIMHCRSVQQKYKAKRRYRMVEKIVNKYCRQTIAIDKTVQKSLPNSLKTKVVHNGFNFENRRMYDQNGGNNAIDELRNCPDNYLKVAMVGNLLKFKGVFEFVKAAKLCIEKKLKIIFIFAGAVPQSREKYSARILKLLNLHHQIGSELYAYIQKNTLTNHFRFIGFTEHIHSVYEHIDILCFPSHLNAVGRPSMEAAFFKIPSIVAISHPLDDTIVPNETGICIKPKDHEELSEAIEFFYRNPGEVERMGAAAYALALKNFDIHKNSRRVLDIYKNCVSTPA